MRSAFHLIFLLSCFSFCQNKIITGIESIAEYLPLLDQKSISIVTNQTGTFPDRKHLVDFLVEKKIRIKKIFAPEHGFRGTADAGETVKNGIDVKTGIPIISLYGKNKKPTKEQIIDSDIIVFDIQDVGVRFYTYVSTLHYVMEAAAEHNIKVIVLDRPNPNAHYVDGYVLNPKFKSFVGMHPVPIVYGMTIGEYANMINGEGWLSKKIKCKLSVIPLKNYTHNSPYELPIKPSPNLPNPHAINLYPSTCFFEGVNVSEGRGTTNPFELYGSPHLKNMPFQFTPKPTEGAKKPRFEGEICFGESLLNEPYLSELKLDWLIKAHQNYSSNTSFWVKNEGSFWIDKLAGTDRLRLALEQKHSAKKIKDSWKKEVKNFLKIRQKYLIYP